MSNSKRRSRRRKTNRNKQQASPELAHCTLTPREDQAETKEQREKTNHNKADMDSILGRLRQSLFEGKSNGWIAVMTVMLTITAVQQCGLAETANKTSQSSQRAFINLKGPQEQGFRLIDDTTKKIASWRI